MLKNLKKYIPKRKFRERSQLEKRKKLGFLEKKQDYKIRAEDFHQKEKRYKKLKEEARLKNPEEFYFKMAKSKLVEGEHYKARDEKDLDKKIGAQNKLLNLVNFKKSMQLKEKEKMSLDLQLHAENNQSTHQIFFDSEEDFVKFDAAEHFDTNQKLLGNKMNRLRTSQLQKLDLDNNEEYIKTMQSQKKNRFKILSEKIKNIDNLNKISSALNYQKHLIVKMY
jgi:U3 small nucleolar RNA-associated protein 11